MSERIYIINSSSFTLQYQDHYVINRITREKLPLVGESDDVASGVLPTRRIFSLSLGFSFLVSLQGTEGLPVTHSRTGRLAGGVSGARVSVSTPPPIKYERKRVRG